MDTELLHILLVEDNPGDARLIRELLIGSADGVYRLDMVTRLSDAVDRLTQSNFAAILLDLTLPDSAGIDTVLRINAVATAPVIVLTGMDDGDIALSAVRAGAQDYLIKGEVTESLLLRAIHYAIERQRSMIEANLSNAVFSSISEGILITDVNGQIVAINPAVTHITGYDEAEMLGNNPRMLQSGRHDPLFYQALWASLLTDGHWKGEIWNRRKSGEIFPEWLTINAVRNSAGHVTHYVGVMMDITQQKQAEDRLFFRATHDALTGLPNRDHFHGRLTHSLARSQRDDTRLAVLMIDLNDFKQINDTLGHRSGDVALQVTAQRLLKSVRKTDLVARLGGDEFVIILEDIEDNQICIRIAETITLALAEPIILDGQPRQISASIGISLCPEDGCIGDILIECADEAMYRAKQAGLGYAFFMPTR
ncbi:diguanylate cyclase [Chloroflexales bacterium ZM16-3]|nr:diguanylate cyclase [Chloroflexales bacterium ZM16-3]